MEAVLDLVGGKWKLLILYHLNGATLRFSELRRLVGNVSEKMLSQQLKELTADGLLRRIDFKTIPPHVEYQLTGIGSDLCESLRVICDWGTHNMHEIALIKRARDVRRMADAA